MELKLVVLLATLASAQQYNTFHYQNHPFIKYMGHHPEFVPHHMMKPEAAAPVHEATPPAAPHPAEPMPHMMMDDMDMKEEMMDMDMMADKKPHHAHAMPHAHQLPHSYTPYHPQPYHHPQPYNAYHAHHEPSYHMPHHHVAHHPAHPVHHAAPYHPTPAPYHPTPAPYHPTPAPYHPTPAPYHPTPEPYHMPHPHPTHHAHPAHPVHPVHPVHPHHAPVHHTPVHHAPVHHAAHSVHHTPHHAYHPDPMPYGYHHYEQPHHVMAHGKDEKMIMMEEHKEDKMMMDHKETELAPNTPKYLGKFSKVSNDVAGDIFLLDEKTIYIQGFHFNGQAPDVHFWSDGVAIPYYTRSHPEVAMVVGEMRGEDVVLMLPPEKPTIKELHHFQVWCRQYGINFGEFSMDNAHV